MLKFLFVVNKKKTKKGNDIRLIYSICPKLTVKTLKRHRWHHYDVFIALLITIGTLSI